MGNSGLPIIYKRSLSKFPLHHDIVAAIPPQKEIDARMKKSLAVLAVSALSAGALQAAALGPPAAASTWKFQTKRIVFNGRTISMPAGIAATDPASKKLTTYMPIYYVMKALEPLGVTSHWNGQTWTMTVDPARVSGAKATPVANNQVVIVINGVKVVSSGKIVAPDPASRVNTTYVPVWYVMQALKRLNITSDWDGQTWSLVDLKPLADAISASDAAVPQQDTVHLTMHMHPNLTPQGETDLGSAGNLDDDTSVAISILVGKWNGEKVTYVQQTVQDSANSDSQQIYIQGSRVYVKDDGGPWQDVTGTPDAQDLLDTAQPDTGFDLQQLSHVKVSAAGSTMTFTGNVDMSSAPPDLVQAAASGLAGQDASSADMQAYLNAVLKRTTGTVTYTLTKTASGWKVTDEQVALHINIPTSILPPSSDKPLVQQEVSSFDVTETVTVHLAYQDVAVTPPAGLPGQSSGTSGDGTPGAGSGGSTSGGAGDTSTGGGAGDTSAGGGSASPSSPLHALKQVWSGYEGDVGSNAVIAGHLVVAADADSNGSVYAYDVQTGQKVWEYRQDQYYHGQLAASPNVVLMTTNQGPNVTGVRALSAADGTPLWSQPVGSVADLQVFQDKAVVVANQAVTVFDASKGTTLWSQTLPASAVRVAASEQGVIVATSDGAVTGYDWNGQQRFRTAVGPSAASGVTIGSDGTAYVVEGKTLTALDAAGQITWTKAMSAPIAGGNVAVDGDSVIVATQDHQITVLKGSDGTLINRGNLPFGAQFAPAVADGIVYVITDEGYLSVIDEASLDTIQTVSQAGPLSDPLSGVATPLVTNGTVIVQSHHSGYSGDATLYAFR
jgi:hypothetical protein